MRARRIDATAPARVRVGFAGSGDASEGGLGLLAAQCRHRQGLVLLNAMEASGSPRLLARLAGFLYVALIVIGAAGYAFSSALVHWDDPARTFAEISSSQTVWRLATLAMLVMLVCDIALASVTDRHRRKPDSHHIRFAPSAISSSFSRTPFASARTKKPSASSSL